MEKEINLTLKESFKLNDFLDDLAYLSTDHPYFGLISVDSKELNEHLIKKFKKKVIVNEPQDEFINFRKILDKHFEKSTQLLIVSLFKKSAETASKLAQTLIGPRDTITYNNLHVIIIVNPKTYKAIFDEAFDLISFANFKFSFHDVRKKQRKNFTFKIKENSYFEEDYENELAFWETNKWTGEFEIDLLKSLSQKALKAKKYNEAYSWGIKMVDKAKFFKNSYLSGIALSNIAQILLNIGRVEEPLNFYKQAIELNDNNFSIHERNEIKERIAYLEIIKGNYDEALKIYEAILIYQKSIKNENEIYRAKLNIAGVLNNKGCLNEANELFDEIGNNLGKVFGVDNFKSVLNQRRGFNYKDMGNLKLALNYFELALQDKTDKRSQAGELHHIGSIYFNMGDLDLTKEYYEKAKEINEDINNLDWIATNLLGLADVEFKKGNLKKTFDLLKKAYKIKEDIGNDSGEIDALVAIGHYYLEENNHLKAKEYIESALDKSKKFNDKNTLIAHKIVLCRIYLESKDFTVLLDLLAEISKHYIETENKYVSYIEVLNLKAKYFLYIQDYKMAFENLSEAKILLNSVENIWREMENKEFFGEYYETQNDYIQSKKNFVKLYRFWEKIGNQKKIKQLDATLNRLEIAINNLTNRESNPLNSLFQ